MSRCDAEMCPMWDGEGCPCETFSLDRDNLPESGTFVIEQAMVHEPMPAGPVGAAAVVDRDDPPRHVVDVGDDSPWRCTD